jgi:hypothetical protein
MTGTKNGKEDPSVYLRFLRLIYLQIGEFNEFTN